MQKGKQRETTGASHATDSRPPLSLASSSTTLPLGDSDVTALNHLGLVPPPNNEPAGAARARHNSNEARLANHVATLEERMNRHDTVSRTHHEEILGLLNAMNDSIPLHITSEMAKHRTSPMTHEPAFKSVLATLAEHRQRLEFLHQRSKSTSQESPAPYDSASTNQRQPAIPLPAPSVPTHITSPVVTNMSPSPLHAPSRVNSRPAHSQDPSGSMGPPQKRPRLASNQPPPSKQGLQHTNEDVIFGPVRDREIPEPTLARHMADVAVDHYGHLDKNDIRSVIALHKRPGYLSIRFKDYSHAFLFLHSVRQSPPLPGQEAYFASEGPERVESTDPLSVLCGKATQQPHW
ncbi:hypothetical protein C0992_003751 [Termitomyces sp. T32_za158]|nr:hypothetical protein C0992_003751 [Termitomyces sp. T32_za158]